MWKRFLDRILVSDFGFRASDLKQGGVGDCWFMSALAVVAERHDLIAKLFVETSRNDSDTYVVFERTKITRKATLECKHNYGKNSTRASRSNTGTDYDFS